MSIGEAKLCGTFGAAMHDITTLRAITFDKIMSFIFYREPSKVNTVITFRMKGALNTQDCRNMFVDLTTIIH